MMPQLFLLFKSRIISALLVMFIMSILCLIVGWNSYQHGTEVGYKRGFTEGYELSAKVSTLRSNINLVTEEELYGHIFGEILQEN